MSVLNPSDIVDIGIEKEKKRRDFYALAAEHFEENSDLAGLFIRLRDWEEDHIRKFKEIRSEVSGGGYAEDYPGELEAYMNALVQSDLYDDINPDDLAKSIKTPVEALERGMTFEKDAILFFSGLSKFLDEKSQEIVEKLIQEEREHLVYLFDMKRKIA
ncbi:MAG: ferritin family protein [Candidatus Krumholzibacteriales bacterium]